MSGSESGNLAPTLSRMEINTFIKISNQNMIGFGGVAQHGKSNSGAPKAGNDHLHE